MSAIGFIKENPYFFNQDLPLKSDWLRVKEQAIEHTRYTENSRLSDMNRPREGKDIKDYRKNNKRRITKAATEKFKTKTARIIRSSGLKVNSDSLSSSLKLYLASKPYTYINQPCDLMTYFLEYIYSLSIDDPNAVEILLPINPDNPGVPPILPANEGGIEKNKSVSIKKIIVSCEEIVAFNENVFSWQGGYMKVPGEAETRQPEAWYWVLDNEWFYRYVPVRVDSQKVVYELQQWYFHDTGIGNQKIMPVNILMGDVVFDETNNFAYQISLISGFFEYGDEFVTRFDDGRAVWVTTAFPIHVMQEMACTAEGCHNGWVKKESGKPVHCEVCHGTGKMDRPSPYGVIVRPKDNSLDASNSGKPYELISPDGQILQITYDIPFDLLKKGERQIGLDVLENSVESGVSREMRFEDVKDKLASISDKMASFLELHLFFTECLLNVDKSTRQIPRVNTPMDFQLKTASDLKKDAEEAIGTDKLQKTLTYYRSIYKDNELLLKVYETAYKYSPLLLVDWQEVKDLHNMGIVEDNDIVRRENAIQVFNEISKQATWLKMSDEKAFEMADDLIEKRGLFKESALVLTNENGEEENG